MHTCTYTARLLCVYSYSINNWYTTIRFRFEKSSSSPYKLYIMIYVRTLRTTKTFHSLLCILKQHTSVSVCRQCVFFHSRKKKPRRHNTIYHKILWRYCYSKIFHDTYPRQLSEQRSSYEYKVVVYFSLINDSFTFLPPQIYVIYKSIISMTCLAHRPSERIFKTINPKHDH
jgi:hypothetical protein